MRYACSCGSSWHQPSRTRHRGPLGRQAGAMTARQLDLLPHVESPAMGMLVELDRTIDRKQPYHDNLATVCAGKAQHATELRCATCERHRGWLPKMALDFLTTTATRFGAPAEPLILRNSTIGVTMTKENKYDNSGSLFRNDDKQKDSDRDYEGSITVAGVEYWLSAWIKQGNKGKFMSLAVKPKEMPAADILFRNDGKQKDSDRDYQGS